MIPPEAGNGKVQLKEKADTCPIKRMIKKALTAKPVKIWRLKTRVIEPAQQIVPNSYLGMALGHIERAQTNGSSSPDSDSSESDSFDDSSSLVSTQDNLESPTSNKESSLSRDYYPHKRGKKTWCSSRKQQKRSALRS